MHCIFPLAQHVIESFSWLHIDSCEYAIKAKMSNYDNKVDLVPCWEFMGNNAYVANYREYILRFLQKIQKQFLDFHNLFY